MITTGVLLRKAEIADTGIMICISSLGIGFLSAGVDIHAGVAVFGPGVDGEVGFREEGDRADAATRELVDHDFDQAGAGGLDRPRDRPAHDGGVLEAVAGAAVEVQETVGSGERTHPRDYSPLPVGVVPRLLPGRA